MWKPRLDKNTILATVAVAAVVVAAGAFLFLYQPQTQTATEAVSPEAELARLASLAAREEITADDLSAIKSILGGDENLEHNLEELESLVGYGEYQHVSHTIGFMDAYLKTGKGVLCPEHELAHYYVFSKHGDVETAEHGLEHARMFMDAWEPRAREFDNKYPSGVPFDERLSNLMTMIEEAENGGPAPADEEVVDLANKAICVEAELGELEDHSEEEETHSENESEGHE